MARNTIFLVAKNEERRKALAHLIDRARGKRDTIIQFSDHVGVSERAVEERPELIIVDEDLEIHVGSFVVHLRGRGYTRSILLLTEDETLIHSHGVCDFVRMPLTQPAALRLLVSQHLDAP